MFGQLIEKLLPDAGSLLGADGSLFGSDSGSLTGALGSLVGSAKKRAIQVNHRFSS